MVALESREPDAIFVDFRGVGINITVVTCASVLGVGVDWFSMSCGRFRKKGNLLL